MRTAASIFVMALFLCGASSPLLARGLGAKYAIMKGTGDYASNGAAAWDKMHRTADSGSCSHLASLCISRSTTMADRNRRCGGAQSRCQQTGVWIGPYSGRVVQATR